MRTLPLTGLIYEGPQARAYLARIRRAGLRFSTLIVMISKCHPATDRPVGRWLPRFLRMPIAEKTQDLALNYWPRTLRTRHGDLVHEMISVLSQHFEGAADTVAEMLGEIRWEDYAEKVERVLVDGLDDPSLTEVMARQSGAVLYTGGGILRPNLLDLPEIRFLHVHPGHLPHVRGADGLLWSLLLRGRPGASCFYMAKGVDTGEVITATDLPVVTFRVPGKRPPDDILYRTVFSFYDPLLRAELLVRHVLTRDLPLERLPTRKQDESTGITFHFLEPPMRRLALDQLFVS